MAKQPQDAEAAMAQNLAAKTGKSLAEWVEIVRRSGRARHGELVNYLKDEHGLTHGYANLVVHTALQSAAGASDGAALVDAQYAGAKAGLRPVYEALVAAVRGFGDDVVVAPKKANVSLRRNKQFALLQPSTATRLDVGINLKDEPPAGRLEASGSFNAMVSHRVRVTSAGEIDAELLGWLRKAYEAS